MGKINQGIFGGVSGSIGNLTGGSWKGINYLRTKAQSVANPRTAAQVGQRNAFSGVVALAKQINVELIKPLWDRFAQKKSGNNAFVSANIGAFDANGDVIAPDLVISQGSLTPVENLAPQAIDADNYRLTWDDNSGEGSALATDVAYALLYDSVADKYYSASGATRADGQIDIETPDSGAWGNAADRCILGFRRADGTLVSTSVNIQGAVI